MIDTHNMPHAVASDDPLCITLGMEEVYVLLRLLHGQEMPGLDLTPFELDARGIPSESARHALAAATNSLIAHGIAEPVDLRRAVANDSRAQTDEPQWKLELPAEVVALLGTCAFGVYTLRLTLLSSTGATDTYLHELERVGVAHTIPLSGVHKFTGLRGREGVLGYLHDLLQLDGQQAINSSAFVVPEGTLYAARDAALAGNAAEAARLLKDAGAIAIAEEFAAAMSHARAIGSAVFAARKPDGIQRQQQFAFVTGATMCFIMTPGDGSGAAYTVQPASAQHLLSHFQETLDHI